MGSALLTRLNLSDFETSNCRPNLMLGRQLFIVCEDIQIKTKKAHMHKKAHAPKLNDKLQIQSLYRKYEPYACRLKA